MLFKLLRTRVNGSNSIWHMVGLHFKVLLFSVLFLHPLFFSHSFHIGHFPVSSLTESQRLKETTVHCKSEIVAGSKWLVSLIPKTTENWAGEKGEGCWRRNSHWMGRSDRSRHPPCRWEIADGEVGRALLAQAFWSVDSLTAPMLVDNLPSNHSP